MIYTFSINYINKQINISTIIMIESIITYLQIWIYFIAFRSLPIYIYITFDEHYNRYKLNWTFNVSQRSKYIDMSTRYYEHHISMKCQNNYRN